MELPQSGTSRFVMLCFGYTGPDLSVFGILDSRQDLTSGIILLVISALATDILMIRQAIFVFFRKIDLYSKQAVVIS